MGWFSKTEEEKLVKELKSELDLIIGMRPEKYQIHIKLIELQRNGGSCEEIRKTYNELVKLWKEELNKLNNQAEALSRLSFDEHRIQSLYDNGLFNVWEAQVLLPTNASVKYDGSEKLGAVGLGAIVAGPVGAAVGAVATSGNKEEWLKKSVELSENGLILGDLLYSWKEFRGVEVEHSVWEVDYFINFVFHNGAVLKIKDKTEEFSKAFANECNRMINGGRAPRLEEKRVNKTIELQNTKSFPQDELLDSIDLNNKGVEMVKNGMCDEAIVYFDKALSIDPEDGTILKNKVAALNEIGEKLLFSHDRYNEAIVYFDKALSIDPENEKALLNKERVLNNRWVEL